MKMNKNGGILTSYVCKNYLNVLPGCIPDNMNYTIRGNVILDYSNYKRMLVSPGNEEFISPVMKYSIDDGYEFINYVRVIIYPVVKLPEDASKLRVYMEHEGERVIVNHESDFNETKDSHSKTPQERIANKELWFCIENGTICVYTYHFSSIYCTLCDDEHKHEVKDISCIRGVLAGKLYEKSNGMFGLVIEFFLQLVRNEHSDTNGRVSYVASMFYLYSFMFHFWQLVHGMFWHNWLKLLR